MCTSAPKPNVWDEYLTPDGGVSRIDAKANRGAKMRVNDDERATSEPTDGASLARAAEDVCTRSFSGTPTTQPELCLDWACGPDVSGRWDDPKRLKIFAYISKFIHRETLRGGPRKAILHARKKDSDEIGAVCVVHLLHGNAQPYGSTLSVVWNMVCRHGLPPFGDIAGCQKRFEAADKLTNAMHKRHGSKSGLRHVYVAMMAVDPSAQGQKLCSKLMRTVSKVADAKGLPCYLECSGEKNREVYRRFGYEVAERCSVKDPGGGPGFDEYYAMVRKSTKSV